MAFLVSLPNVSLVTSVVTGVIAFLASLIVVYRFGKERFQNTLESKYQQGYEEGHEDGFDEGHERAKRSFEENSYTAENERVLERSIQSIQSSHAEEMWGSASDYVCFVSLTGYPWLPDAAVIEEKLAEGVEVKLLLTAPSEENVIDLMKLERVETASDLLSTEDSLITERYKVDLMRGITDTLDCLGDSLPAENIRFSRQTPIWKGTIVDGDRARYVLYDMPRSNDVPFRYTEEPAMIEFIEERYFNSRWESAMTLDEFDSQFSMKQEEI